LITATGGEGGHEGHHREKWQFVHLVELRRKGWIGRRAEFSPVVREGSRDVVKLFRITKWVAESE
jgi:hypothetical protein